MNNNPPLPILTTDTLIDSLILLATRKHGDNCVFTMDSRLACSCGAELHNAKVNGVSIRLKDSLKPKADTEMKPMRQRPAAAPAPAPQKEAQKETLPGQAQMPVIKETPVAMPKFETGTSIPHIDMNLPMAPVQPAPPVQPNKQHSSRK